MLFAGFASYAWYPLSKAPQGPADKLLILKSQHKLILLRNGGELRSYPMSIGRQRSALGGFPPGADIMIQGIENGLGWIGRFHRCLDWRTAALR